MVLEGFVVFAGAGEQKAVGGFCVAGLLVAFHGGDEVSAAEPVGFGEVGWGPLGGVVGVGVVETYDVEACGAGFALGLDQLERRDAIAVVGAVGAGVAGAEEFFDLDACWGSTAEQDAAALMRVGFFAVGAELVVEVLRDF